RPARWVALEPWPVSSNGEHLGPRISLTSEQVAHLRGHGLTLLMLTPELAGRADLREGCPYGKAEKVHAGVPSGGGGAGAGYGSADRARGRGDRRGCATAGSLGPAGTRAARSASEPGDAFDRPGAGGAQTAAAAGP